MVSRLYGTMLGCIGLWSVCMLITPSPGWSASDKTTVDLERGLPEAPSRYHRPRGAQRYHADKTEVDLAVPLPQATQEPQSSPARQTPQTPAISTPGTLLPPTAPPK